MYKKLDFYDSFVLKSSLRTESILKDSYLTSWSYFKILWKCVKQEKSYQPKFFFVIFEMFTLVTDIYERIQINFEKIVFFISCPIINVRCYIAVILPFLVILQLIPILGPSTWFLSNVYHGKSCLPWWEKYFCKNHFFI